MNNSIKGLFGKILSDDKVDEILKNDSSISPVQRSISVLVLNITNFKYLLKSATQKEITEFIDLYYDLVIGIVDFSEGNIDKFMADKILILYNWPQSHKNHEQVAYKVGVKILNEFNNKLYHFIQKYNISLNVGISEGEVLAGSFGNNIRKTVTVIGESVNEAFRLSEMKVGEGIYISEGILKENRKNINKTELLSEGNSKIYKIII